jgi:hypothetical protein
MKYLKPIFESDDRFTFSDIIEILDELIDDGMQIVIYAANGIAYYPDDISRKGINDIFKFQRYQNAKKSFKFRIDFNTNLNYIETVDILNKLKSVVGRFDDLGFQLSGFYLNSDNESDHFRLHSIEYNFESYN